jgi:hypothetical protein
MPTKCFVKPGSIGARPTQRFSCVGLLCLSLIALSSLGCSDRLATYPVAGKVKFKTGGPVHVGTVELKSREHGVQARGSIETDGTFVLTTYEAGDGAVAGMHDCVIVQFVMTEGIEGHRGSTLGVIDPKYGSYASSGLALEIKPETQNEIVLEVDGIRKTQPEDHKH